MNERRAFCDPIRLVPAHQDMKCRRCGWVQRIGTADSATRHPDPCGGQAPALHLVIPPSTISLRFGTFRPWRAGIEVDWRAHPGSDSGTCFRTNDEMRARNDEGMSRVPNEKPRNVIFVRMTNLGAGTTSAWAVAFSHTRGRVTSFSYQ